MFEEMSHNTVLNKSRFNMCHILLCLLVEINDKIPLFDIGLCNILLILIFVLTVYSNSARKYSELGLKRSTYK